MPLNPSVYYELAFAIHSNDNDTVERLIDANKDHINERAVFGQATFLHQSLGAVPELELAKRLLELPNIDVNITDSNGFTPLHTACYNEHSEVIPQLIAHYNKDTISRPNASGFTPLSVCKTKKTAELLLKNGANLFNATRWENDDIKNNIIRIETFKYLNSKSNGWGMTSNQPTVAVKPASNPRDNNRQDTKPPAKRSSIFK